MRYVEPDPLISVSTSRFRTRLERNLVIHPAISSELDFVMILAIIPPATAHQTPSHHFIRHLLNLRHVVVVNGLLTAVIPFDGYARPIRFSDGALVGSIVLPANTVADFEGSGFVAGHLIGCPQTPHGEFDLSIGLLPPMLNSRHITAMRNLIDDFACLEASRFYR
jgi:hypothetical protein